MTSQVQVLLVEDEEMVRKVLRRMLVREGFEVMEATGGGDALERLASMERVDLVLSDVVMPGMSGMDFVLELLRRRPGTRFLLMSGWDEHPALPGSGNGVLHKPFDSGQLLAAITETLADAGVP